MTDTIINFSTNQSAANLLLSESDIQTLIDSSVLAAIPTFSDATNYFAGEKVYYLGIFYVAPVNINLGGGNPLVNTTWRQIPTWGSYTTTATAAGTTTLDLYSSEIQRFSGVTTQIITLPVVTTLPALGKPFYIINDSTGTLTVNSSGGNLVATILAGQRYLINCILLTGTTAASWTVSSGSETATSIGSIISGSTAKTTLVDADLIPLDDSAASNILKNITWQNLKASIFAYTTTATAAGTTTLTAASTLYQFFTGATTQTVTLPVTSTLYTGLKYTVYNNSSGLVTVQSSGANTILILAGGTSAEFVCILTSGTTAASWQLKYDGTIVTSGKKASVSNSITFAGTDGTTQTFQGTDTILGRGTTDTITGVKTFDDGKLKLNGATSGASTLKAPAIAGAYVHTFPARTGTIADNTDLALKADLAGATFSGNVGLGSSFVTFHDRALGLYGASSASLKLINSTTGTGNTDGFEIAISGSDGYLQNRETGGHIFLYTEAAERIKIQNDGVIVLTSGQLKFPATQNASSDANTLDDYEEGTVVVGFSCATGSITIDNSYKTLNYTKIGNCVHVGGLLSVTSVSTPTGAFKITGLPFTVASGVTSRVGSAMNCSGLTSANSAPIYGYVEEGATTCIIQKVVLGARTDIATEVVASTQIPVGFFYFI